MPDIFDEEEDNSIDKEKLTEDLINRAQKGEHSKFEFIKNIDTYRAARIVAKATKKVADSMVKAQAISIEKYLEQAEAGMDYMPLLTDSRIFERCADFYTKEYNLVCNEMYEYECYLRFGHWLDLLLGKEREEGDLVDFSGNGWTAE